MAIEIKGFISNSLLDWEGKIASVIFLPYCNLECPYCYASKLIKTPEKLKTISKQEILSFLKQKSGWIDGVVILGGEPTIHKDLPEFIQDFKSLDLQIKLDTNGTCPDMIKLLLKEKLLDYIAMDIKAPLDQEKYNKAAGTQVDLDAIKESIALIRESGIDYEFRTTFSKSFLLLDDLVNISKYIKGAKRYRLQKFLKKEGEMLDETLDNKDEYTDEEIAKTLEQIKEYIDDVRVR